MSLAGIGLALLARAHRGLGPWEIVADGVHRQTGLALGTSALIVGLIALGFWIPLKERPGVGTVIAVIVFGVATNVALPHVPNASNLLTQSFYIGAAIAIWSLGIAIYLDAQLGAGPRDGIMKGLAKRGHSIRRVRTITEVIALLAGVSLGGSAGPATLIYAVTIGPCIQGWFVLLHRQRNP